MSVTDVQDLWIAGNKSPALPASVHVVYKKTTITPPGCVCVCVAQMCTCMHICVGVCYCTGQF